VVRRVVHRVHADGIDAQLLELDDIPRAARDVRDGIGGPRGASGLVIDAADIESVVAGEEGWGR